MSRSSRRQSGGAAAANRGHEAIKCPEWGSAVTAAHIPTMLQFQHSEHWHMHALFVLLYLKGRWSDSHRKVNVLTFITQTFPSVNLSDWNSCVCSQDFPPFLEICRHSLSGCTSRCGQFGYFVSLFWPGTDFGQTEQSIWDITKGSLKVLWQIIWIWYADKKIMKIISVTVLQNSTSRY